MSTTTSKVVWYLRTTDPGRARQGDCAAQLGLNVTALYRLLSYECQTYKALADADKKRRAMEAIESNPDITAWEIAEICGYSCGQDATRALRRWTGMTLTDYKQSQSANEPRQWVAGRAVHPAHGVSAVPPAKGL